MAEKTNVTLLAERGRDFEAKKEAIGSHGRSIVFLPRGVQPGEKVRVELVEVRPDARGTMMYRGMPAAPTRVEKWRVNADGTASRVAYSVDWKLQETEVGVLETRPFGRRERESYTTEEKQAVWGADAASSKVIVTQVAVIVLEEERVSGDALAWVQTGERREPRGTTEYPVAEVVNTPPFDWALLAPTAVFRVRIQYQVPGRSYLDEADTSLGWGNLPGFVKAEFGASHPPCSCGRERYKAAEAVKCRTCVAEAACDRCGGKVGEDKKFLAGQLVCRDCEPMATLEKLVSDHLPIERRQELAGQAARLAAVEPVPGQAGEIILRSSLEHVGDHWRRNSLAQKCAGYAWYYFTDEGVFGSKLPRPALQVLAHLASASGNGLVELVGWMAGPHQRDAYGAYEQSYWHRTQEQGETATPSFVSSDLERLAVAVRLRGSEADRLAALAALDALIAQVGADSECVKAARDVLQDDEQDYATAVAMIGRAASEEADLKAAEERGELLSEVETTCDTRYSRGHIWVVRPDGTLREADRTRSARRYTTYTWCVVRDELVLVHEVAVTTSVPVSTGVVWRPKIVTRAQVAAVERLELEHGLGGTFEVDPELVAKRARMMEEIWREILRMSPDEDVQEPRFLDVSGSNGLALRHDDPGRLVNHAKPFEASCDGRDAQVVRSVRCAGGVLEFLVYHKYGNWNLSARWRPLTDEEQAAAPPAAPVTSGGPAGLSFTDEGKRWFRCECEGTVRVESATYQRYNAGEEVTLACIRCRRTGTARKA